MAQGGSRAYIGSFTAAGGRGILTAARDTETGALGVLGATGDKLPDPSFLAAGPGGDLVYAVSETADGAVAAFRAGPDGLRPQGEPVAVGGSGPTHLCVFARHLLTANYGSGSVSAVSLRPDGTPFARASVLLHEGAGPHPQRQQGPHAHQVVAAPGGRFAVSVDLGTDSVRVCTLGPSGELKLHREVALRPGSGPRHLVFHPTGSHAYVLNELAPTLTVCRWDRETGALQPDLEVPVLPGVPDGEAAASGIVVSPDGRFLWTATRGEDVVSVFALDPAGAAPALVGAVACGGRWPRDLALAPGGRHLYVANERSGDVTWFTLDADTGVPRHEGAVSAPAASCVIFV
ncbi:lactonase family protein [Streptomyces sp. NPDC050560]|uniref:lactonase family protein n=1 Tax=Streptomyces sp. NPDC050560 TaxID=3365630 RepID=UPI0037B738C9